jgi:hypothetical protein
MSNLRPEETIDTLVDRFPAFAQSVDLEEGPYSVLSDFAIYIRDNIESDSFASADLENVFEFLNQLGSSENREVQNQLVVGILEILTDTDKCTEMARQKLRGQALGFFERVLIGWNHA